MDGCDEPHHARKPGLKPSRLFLAGIRTPAKNICFAWLVENKGNPKKAKKQKGELILGKYWVLMLGNRMGNRWVSEGWCGMDI